jgi:hypothetical protein
MLRIFNNFGSACLYYFRISCTLLVLAGSLCDSDFGTVVLAVRLQVDSTINESDATVRIL